MKCLLAVRAQVILADDDLHMGSRAAISQRFFVRNRTRAGFSTLNKGERVSFDIAQDRGKTHAANLKLA